MTTPDVSSVKSLPKEAWIGIIAVGAGIVWWSKRGSSSTAIAPTSVDTGGVPGVGVGGSGMWTDVSPTAPDAPPKIAITTNTDWRMAATSWLVANNYDPALADEAITRYLNGLVLSPSQGVMVSVAIRAIGPTPEDLPPGPAVPIVPGVNNPSTGGSNTPSTTQPNITPGTPSNVRVSGTTVSWNAVPGAVSYIVNSDGKPHSTNGTTYKFTQYSKGHNYSITVQAVGPTGLKSPNSKTVVMKTPK